MQVLFTSIIDETVLNTWVDSTLAYHITDHVNSIVLEILMMTLQGYKQNTTWMYNHVIMCNISHSFKVPFA